MTLQLRAIAIYSHTGERREVEFELGRLNIVTGASKTGKSALLDIVDFCWGRDECTVAEGEIRRSVKWFAVLFDNDGEGIFIARHNPGPGGRGADHIYFERNIDELPASASHFLQNVTAVALRSHLSQILGIAENLYVPEPGATRVPLSASASQAIFFSLQAQDEIANRRLLFHRQGEQHIPVAIKDTLPYFLGAMEEDYYLKQRRYNEARARLRRLEKDLNELRALTTNATTATEALLQDAKKVGLVEADVFPETTEELRGVLRGASAPREFHYAKTDDAASDLADLEDRRRLIRGQLMELREEHAQFVRLDREATDFTVEARAQEARLASIGLIASEAEGHESCPLCESKLAVAVPSVSQIRESLRHVGQQLTTVSRDRPRLQEHIASLEVQRAELEEQQRTVQRDIATRIADNERVRIEQDLFTEQARVAGRIGYYLENVQAIQEDNGLRLAVARGRAEVAELEKALDPEALNERIATALSLVGRDLTAYAQALQLEHGDNPLRLDRKNLTVVADTDEGALALSQIGSGENWVGYHVAAHLALHRLFRARKRPVPALLMLDQPSQAHYPPDRDAGVISADEDEDQAAVARLYRELYNYCEALGGAMQIIVADHVELLEPWFTDATAQRWRDGIKLVPMSWLRGE
jgi:hypothetical protein